jgi:SAM-dependent methyltransferase
MVVSVSIERQGMRPEVVLDVRKTLDEYLPGDRRYEVLDAGCGDRLKLEIPPGAHITGIDIDAGMFRQNGSIDERIVGDIQSYPFPADAFDLMICWCVLEHVPRPTDALSNLSSCLRPGGLLVVGVPNLYSMKALVTKFTPYGFHRWAMHRFFDGVDPCRTYLRRDAAPARIQRTLARSGLAPVYSLKYCDEPTDRLPSGLQAIWNTMCSVAAGGTLGFWDPHASEYVGVFRKATMVERSERSERKKQGNLAGAHSMIRPE